jgi:hypothetical protein
MTVSQKIATLLSVSEPKGSFKEDLQSQSKDWRANWVFANQFHHDLLTRTEL